MAMVRTIALPALMRCNLNENREVTFLLQIIVSQFLKKPDGVIYEYF